MVRILGVDPGSRITGFGVIDSDGRRSVHVVSGAIRLPEAALAQRLCRVFEALRDIVARYAPAEMAIEQVFMARSADAALKLGQARGAAICAGAAAGLAVHEYAARTVKQAVVGTGAASKEQVQHMIMRLLALAEAPAADAADALAIAWCHGQMQRAPGGLPANHGRRTRRRWTLQALS